MLVETCVSFGDGEELNPVEEPDRHPSQAVSGRGCRPTRAWVWNRLRRHFEHVYAPSTQPWHPEFPLDWTGSPPEGLARAIFVSARCRLTLDNPVLVDALPSLQARG